MRELEPALEHLRRMDEAPDCDWGIHLQSPPIEINLSSNLGEQRHLATLMMDAAGRTHATGDERQALELIRLAMAVGDAANVDVPMLINHLVCISIHALVCGKMHDIAPTLDFNSNETPRVEAGKLLSRLLDESVLKDSFTRAWVGERWMQYDTGSAVIDGRLGVNSLMSGGGSVPNALHHVAMAAFKPVFVNDLRFMVDYGTALVEASRSADSDPAFRELLEKRFGGDPERVIQDSRTASPLSGLLLPAMGAAARSHFKVLALQRMAATALAIRLYQANHGHRPDTLEQLVPEFLPAVPRDAYTKKDPIRYRPQGATLVSGMHVRHDSVRTVKTLPFAGPAILYCVGANGEDNGGRVVVDSAGRIDHEERFGDIGDHWFLLDEEPEAYDLSAVKA